MVFLNFLATPEDDTRTPLRFTLVAEEAGSLDLESTAVREFITLLRERGTVVDPTVTIFDSMFRHRSGSLNPSYAMIAEHLPPAVRRGLLSSSLDITADNAARYAASADALLAMIAALHRAGVTLVAGTDALTGFTLHRELELYGRAGIPTADVLRLATIGAARVVGVETELGRIAPGYRAEMVLLDGDPLADLSALRRVSLTLRGNRYYRAAELHKAIGVRPFVASEVAVKEAERD
jgi:imidazolonepropionase-like amidohydrolase